MLTTRPLPQAVLTCDALLECAYAIAAEAQVAARTTIKEALKRGMSAVRELDAIVRNKFRNDPVVLAEWEHAVRITPAKRKTAAPEPPPKPQ